MCPEGVNCPGIKKCGSAFGQGNSRVSEVVLNLFKNVIDSFHFSRGL